MGFPKTVYNIGDTGPAGGIIFYHDLDGFTMAVVTGTSEDIGAGKKNTAKPSIDDWFLPSTLELSKLGDSEVPIFSPAWYWSSVDASGNAVSWNFGYKQAETAGRSNLMPVRAIRAF